MKLLLNLNRYAHRSLLLLASLGVSSALAQPPATRIVFPPSPPDAPQLRHDGETRGQQDGLPKVFVLTQRTLTLTTHEMPTLFWFVSGPTKASVKITLSDDADAEPLLKLTPDGIAAGGIQRLDLAAHKIRLEPEVQYTFAVVISTKNEDPPRRRFSSGVIKRVRPDEQLQARLQKADRAERPDIFSAAGIWCDMLTSLSDGIDADPGNANLRLKRAGLLDQIERPAAAQADRQTAAEIKKTPTTKP